MGRRQIVWRRVEVPIGRSAGPALADEPKEEQAEPRVGRPDWCGPEATPVQGRKAGPNRRATAPRAGDSHANEWEVAGGIPIEPYRNRVNRCDNFGRRPGLNRPL